MAIHTSTTTTTTTTQYVEVSGSKAILRLAWVAALVIEVSVLRTWQQQRPTFQGEIVRVAGAWEAFAPVDAKASALASVGVFANLRDAARALLRVRTGCLSTVTWDGPRPDAPLDYCTCGCLVPRGEGCPLEFAECRRLTLLNQAARAAA